MNISKCLVKKNFKKIEKIKLRLTNKNGIIFSDQPTEIIVIANAGLANDVKRYELENYLSPYDQHIKNIITPSQLTFAIVICNDCVSSVEIFSNLQFFNILTPDLKIRPSVNVFCLYVSHLPANIASDIINFSASKPPGLILIDEFIKIEEEKMLVESFTSLKEANANSDLKHRTVVHFGYEFNYNNNLVDFSKPLLDKPIPKLCSELLLRLEHETGKTYSAFDQLTVNMYQPGDGIPPHTDTHSIFTDEIVSISLNSDIIMEWTNHDSQDVRNVDLKARSACIMTGESRYLWKHGIVPRKSDLIFYPEENHFEKRQRAFRISLTFRKVKQSPGCQCPWPQNCDIKRDVKSEFCPDRPAQLEEEFVHKVYDSIASHFSSTRHSMWPKVRAFIERQPVASVGSDIGCGNGKYFPAILRRGMLLGTDSSFNLCKIASERHNVDTIQSNLLQLPYRRGCCDYWICIAVLHHLSTTQRRKEALEKMAAMLRVGGQGLIYVWAQDQEKNGVKSKYLDRKSTHSKPEQNSDSINPLPVHLNRTQFSTADMLVPWCKKSEEKSGDSKEEVYTRYYHLFQQGELEDLCLTIEGVRVLESWYDSGNWAVVIERL